MEFLLFWWDELDDWSGACRHVAGSAVAEVAAMGVPLATASSAVAVWLLMPHLWANAAIMAAVGALWGVYQHVLRLSGI